MKKHFWASLTFTNGYTILYVMKLRRGYIFLLLALLMGAMLSDISSPIPFDSSSEVKVEVLAEKNGAETTVDDNFILTTQHICLKNESLNLRLLDASLIPSTSILNDFFRPPIAQLS